MSIKRLIPLVDQAIVSGGNFLLGVLLARVLGLAVYGEFAIVWLIVLFCSSIHHAWIITPLYTFSSKVTGVEKKKYLQSVMVHQLLFAVVASLLVLVIIFIAKLFFPEWSIAQANIIVAMMAFCYLMYDFFRRFAYVKGRLYRALFLDAVV